MMKCIVFNISTHTLFMWNLTDEVGDDYASPRHDVPLSTLSILLPSSNYRGCHEIVLVTSEPAPDLGRPAFNGGVWVDACISNVPVISLARVPSAQLWRAMSTIGCTQSRIKGLESQPANQVVLVVSS